MRLLLTHVPQARRQYYGAPRARRRLQELVEVVLHEGDAPLDPTGRDRGGPRRRLHHRRPRDAGAGRDLRRPAEAQGRDAQRHRHPQHRRRGGLEGRRAGDPCRGGLRAVGGRADARLPGRSLARRLARGDATITLAAMPEIKVGRQLGGSTVGIIGYGRISRALAPRAGGARHHGAGVRSLRPGRRPALRQTADWRSCWPRPTT